MPPPDPYARPPDDPARTNPRKPDADSGSGASESTSNRDLSATVKSGVRPALPATLPAKIGRFEIRAVLGEGAFGCVYRGFDAELERDVAIKVPHGSAMTAGFRERFLREARAAAALHHPNICPIYQASTDGDVPFLVMHFVSGPTLSSLLDNRKTPFPIKQAAVVVRKLALGVAAAHAQGVVHRDLKPANVLVDEVRREVLITDFGVARVGDAGQTIEGEIVGTPAYMSPEQARGLKAEVGPLSDVYSLGVILYKLLTGQVPYTGGMYEVLVQVWEGNPTPPSALRRDLDPRLNDLCLKAMAKEPKNRFPSAEALALALENYLRARTPDESGEQPAITAPTARPVTIQQGETVEAELVFDLPTAARPALALMRGVAEAALAKGLSGLSRRVADPAFALELAAEALRRVRAPNPGALRQMLEVTAAANITDAQVGAAQAAWEVAAQAPEAERLALEMYLGQLPDAIRKVFKRADDPQGVTVPREFRPEVPASFAAVLPRRVPRFRDGQGLPGRADWVLVRWLGGGGFGEVWLAQHRKIANRFGAVKFGLDLTANQRALLTHEARLAAQALDRNPHPGLVPLVDTELGGETPWLMYEYVGGGDLADLVLAWQLLPAAGRVRAVIERLREVVEAVAALHQLRPPVVHRDLKPSNILRDARTFRLRVTDFGVGGVAVEGQMGRTRGAMPPELRGAHSLLYASPQQQRGAPPDPRDDVHALGVLAFQMFTGRLTSGVPTDYDRVLRNLGVPPGLVQLLGRCAASDPNQRPRDARALADMLAPHAPLDEMQPVPTVGAPLKPASAFVLETDEKTTQTEILVCPVCKARLQVVVGRTQHVPCPRCSTMFSPAAGRVALKAKPVAPPQEMLELDPDPEPPRPRPTRRPPPRRREDAEPRRPRRSFRRVYSCGCFLFLIGALAGAGFLFEDELTAWVKSYQAKPVEFQPGREFEPGADNARVYGFVPGDPSRLLTNADRKDVFAAVWNTKTGKREYVLKSGPIIPTAVLDPKITQFRVHDDRLAVFNRDTQITDRGGVWVYNLPPIIGDDAKAKDAKPGAVVPDREVTSTELGTRRRTWDVNRDLTRAVGPPMGGKAALWSLTTGGAITDLSVDGTTFRALAFSPDGKYVVGLCDQSRVHVWDATSGKPEPERAARLETRPAWDASELGVMSFDPAFTRLTLTNESKVGSWDLKTGAVVDPMKKLSDGALLNQKYRLRCESGGTGTFSVFHDEFTPRACKLKIAGDAGVTTWCLSDDRTALAASSNRKVQTWKLKYPPGK